MRLIGKDNQFFKVVSSYFYVNYGRLIEGFSSLLAPLMRKEECFLRADAYEESFHTVKVRLTTTSLLSPLDGHDNFVMYSDASNVGLVCFLT